METIVAAQQQPPPAWAIKQRHLMDTMDAAAPLFMNKYVHWDGTLKRHGKIDDDYECFTSWPLFYAMGGRREILDWSQVCWNGITRQWTYQQSQAVHREFMHHNDMLHLSEGYVGFQNAALAMPDLPESADRALRFARLYTGDDPAVANYDRDRRLIRSPVTGSGGPQFSGSPDYVLNYGFASLYPRLAQLEPGWDQDPARHAEIARLYDEMVMRGDVPMNLAVTGLVTHAHILTGDARCREWVLEYVDAWMERTACNGGIIPDNVGLSGRIGETRGGQWWGGFFGWCGRYSVWMIFHALRTATECAYLLSRDRRYLAFYRSQMDYLLERAVERDGDLLVPYKVGPDGWYDYRPLDPYVAGHLWHLSMEDQDWERLQRLHAGAAHGPHAYAYAESPHPPAPGSEEWRPAGPADWNRLTDELSGNKFVENEPAHLRYLGGANPEWPQQILDLTLGQVCRAAARLRDDAYEHEWRSQTVTAQNPVLTAGLGQMLFGAPFPCFNGGLLNARVRYFDPQQRRPGLPPDVAALMEQKAADRTVIQLVNLSVAAERRVVVQAGAYAEHLFTGVSWNGSEQEDAGQDYGGRGNGVSWNDGEQDSGAYRALGSGFRALQVALPPGTGLRLRLDTRCHVRAPTYAFPWDRDG